MSEAPKTKSLDENFRDWENQVFGYGYGTGEPHTIPALKAFLAAIPERSYDHKVLEAAVGPVAAWMLINTLCHADAIEYGTSPRYGWLTPKGEALKAYIDRRSDDELLAAACDYDPSDYAPCYPDTCNCGPKGYEAGRVCANPFWGPAPLNDPKAAEGKAPHE